MSDPRGKVRLRGRIPLRLALIFGVIGLALAVTGVVVLVNSPVGRIDDFPRIAADGQTHQVRLDAGDHVAYVERPSGSNLPASASGLRIAQGGQRPVRIGQYNDSTTLTYDIGGRHGRAYATFRIDRAGTYDVAMQSLGESGTEVALGESIADGIVPGVLLFVPGLLLVIAAVVLLIVGLVRRSGHRRQLASGYGQYPPQPGFGPPRGY